MYIPILYLNGRSYKALIGFDMATAESKVRVLNEASEGITDNTFSVKEKYTNKSDYDILKFLDVDGDD